MVIAETALAPQPATDLKLSGREAWLKRHQSYIGGSEAYELLNQEQYGMGCATALAYRKLGATPDFPDEFEDDPILRRGKILEPLVGFLYEEQTGRKVRRPPMDEDGAPKERLHPRYSWAGVNTDRIILTGAGGVTETGDLEIKTRGEGPWYRVRRLGPFVGDLLQPQWSMFVTGHSWGALAILGVFGSLPLTHFDVKREPEIQNIFEREGSEFAETVWGKRQVPDPVIAASDQRCKVCQFRLTCRGEQIDRAEARALREIRKSKKELVQIDNGELAHTLADIDVIKQERKALDETLEVAKTKALEMMGNTEAALIRGYGKVYRLPTQANYLDTQRLKADKPDVYDDYFVSRLTGDHYLRTYPEKVI